MNKKLLFTLGLIGVGITAWFYLKKQTVPVVYKDSAGNVIDTSTLVGGIAKNGDWVLALMNDGTYVQGRYNEATPAYTPSGLIMDINRPAMPMSIAIKYYGNRSDIKSIVGKLLRGVSCMEDPYCIDESGGFNHADMPPSGLFKAQ